MAAEFGANITSGTAGSFPSIFEVLAQESLKASVQPALEHAVRVYIYLNIIISIVFIDEEYFAVS